MLAWPRTLLLISDSHCVSSDVGTTISVPAAGWPERSVASCAGSVGASSATASTSTASAAPLATGERPPAATPPFSAEHAATRQPGDTALVLCGCSLPLAAALLSVPSAAAPREAPPAVASEVAADAPPALCDALVVASGAFGAMMDRRFRLAALKSTETRCHLRSGSTLLLTRSAIMVTVLPSPCTAARFSALLHFRNSSAKSAVMRLGAR